MRKNKPLDESHKTGQTSGTKMAFYNLLKLESICCSFYSTLPNQKIAIFNI
ncbi:hypothetical protein Hanom_Chr07g00669911 [Helianthus anomalus]